MSRVPDCLPENLGKDDDPHRFCNEMIGRLFAVVRSYQGVTSRADVVFALDALKIELFRLWREEDDSERQRECE